MNTFLRWWRFNLVGAMGVVVQLAALSFINRLAAGHYLYATLAAIELALLHNFVWHLHYTWRDRSSDAPILTQLLRFHLSNGMVSMAGNLVLMPLLVEEAHLPVLASNGIAILCCSMVNFGLSDTWTFGDKEKQLMQRTTSAAASLRPEPHGPALPAPAAASPVARPPSSTYP